MRPLEQRKNCLILERFFRFLFKEGLNERLKQVWVGSELKVVEVRILKLSKIVNAFNKEMYSRLHCRDHTKFFNQIMWSEKFQDMKKKNQGLF